MKFKLYLILWKSYKNSTKVNLLYVSAYIMYCVGNFTAKIYVNTNFQPRYE
jgi:hypothetical protein